MNLQPCAIPVLASGKRALEFWNAALTHADSEIEIPGSEAAFAFRPGSRPVSKKSGFLLSLEEGPCLLLTVEDFDFSGWTGVELSYEEASSLPATIRKALDRGIVEAAFELFPDQIRERIKEIIPLDPGKLAKEAKARSPSWLELELGAEDRPPARFLIGVAVDDLPAVLGLETVQVLATEIEAFGVIPVRVVYSLGSLSLLQKEIAALEQDDLILFQAHSNRSVFYVTAPHARYGFTLLDQQWVCTEVRPHRQGNGAASKDTRMAGGNIDPEDDDDEELLELIPDGEDAASGQESAATVPSEQEPDPEPISTIPILLEFEVGRMSVPVGELEQWREGTIVEIEPPRIDDAVTVTIRANGRVIGNGDLVRIGDRLAVRIARISAPAGNAGHARDDEDDDE